MKRGDDPALAEPRVTRTEGAINLRVPADPTSLRLVRHEVRTFLSDRGIDASDVEDLVLATSEAANNAIEHPQEPTEPYIEIVATEQDDLVAIDVRDFGRWRSDGPEADRGRGSALMEAFADVRVTPSADGTRVSLTRDFGAN